jgi:hypothetical protein
MSKTTQKQEIINVLKRAGDKRESKGCPYLALSDELGYITTYVATHNADKGLSNLGRLSVRKMLQTGGFSTKYAQYIYEELECGKSLTSIAENFSEGYFYFLETRKVIKELQQLSKHPKDNSD